MCQRDPRPVPVGGVNGTSVAAPAPDRNSRPSSAVNGATSDEAESLRKRIDRMLAQQRQFVSDAAHELLTPIAGLRTQLEEAQLHPDTTELDKLLGRALRDVDRLQAIVSDLLVLAKVGMRASGEPARVDLAELVETEIATRADPLPVLPRLTPGTTVEVVCHEVRRLVANLLDNAQRHGKHVLQVEVREDGGHAELVVADDGCGIPPAERAWIFERFARLDTARSRSHGGAGLGLAIVRDIAEAHGGTVTVEESASGGARFVVRLPLADRLDVP